MTHHIINECPVCESTDITAQRMTIRQAFGLPAVTLENVLRIECRECGESSTAFPRHGELMRQIRYRLCFIGRVFRGAEFAFLRIGLGFSQEFIGELMGVSNVTVSRWENEASGISEQTDLVLRLLTLDDLGCASSIEKVVEARISGRRTFEIDVTEVVADLKRIEFEQALRAVNEDIWPFDEIRKVA